MIENIKRFVNENYIFVVIIICLLVACFFYWWLCCKNRSFKVEGGTLPCIIAKIDSSPDLGKDLSPGPIHGINNGVEGAYWSTLGYLCQPFVDNGGGELIIDENATLFVLNHHGLKVIIDEVNDLLVNNGLSSQMFTNSELFKIIRNPVHYLFPNIDEKEQHSTLRNLFGDDMDKIRQVMATIDETKNFNIHLVLDQVDQGMKDTILTHFAFLHTMFENIGGDGIDVIDFIGQKGHIVNEEVIGEQNTLQLYKSNCVNEDEKIVNTLESVEAEKNIAEVEGDEEEIVPAEISSLYETFMDCVSEKTELGGELSEDFQASMFKTCNSAIRNWYMNDIEWYYPLLSNYQLDEETGLIEITRDNVIDFDMLPEFVNNFFVKKYLDSEKNKFIKKDQKMRRGFEKNLYNLVNGDEIKEIMRGIFHETADLAQDQVEVLHKVASSLKDTMVITQKDENLNVWKSLVIGYIEYNNRLKQLAIDSPEGKIKMEFVDEGGVNQTIYFNYSTTTNPKIGKCLSEFLKSTDSKLFDIADIYPAQKVLMCVFYLCKYFGILKAVDKLNLKKGLAAYMIYVHLFNSFCACHMEHAWNRSISNEYVYNIINRYIKRPDFQMKKLTLLLLGNEIIQKIETKEDAEQLLETADENQLKIINEVTADKANQMKAMRESSKTTDDSADPATVVGKSHKASSRALFVARNEKNSRDDIIASITSYMLKLNAELIKDHDITSIVPNLVLDIRAALAQNTDLDKNIICGDPSFQKYVTELITGLVAGT